MSRRTIEQHLGFNLYLTKIADEHFFITASVVETRFDQILVVKEIFERISEILAEAQLTIVHERHFGTIDQFSQIQKIRRTAFSQRKLNVESPVTFVEGKPAWGQGFSGLQIRAVKPCSAEDRIWTIYEKQTACGCGWKRNGTTYIFLQNIHGFQNNSTAHNNRFAQTSRMFERANQLLKAQGVSYQNVVRTWIYLTDILEWYGEFNQVRNEKYKEYNIITNHSTTKPVYEEICLPASTGILAQNPIKAAGVMDVLAVVAGENSTVEIKQTAGVKQRSPYRYGSAFSRAMSVREPDRTSIFVSGTAAIDEHGVSLFPGDTRAQIIKTLEVVEALIASEGASLNDICDATVFLKRAEDLPVYYQTIEEIGLHGLPAVSVVADVCRNDLLFEIDATVLT